MSEQHTPETDSEAYMVECTSIQNYGIEDPSAVVDAAFARKLERQRDELLAALKDALCELAYSGRQKAHDRAWAAIAKVKGGGA